MLSIQKDFGAVEMDDWRFSGEKQGKRNFRQKKNSPLFYDLLTLLGFMQ